MKHIISTPISLLLSFFVLLIAFTGCALITPPTKKEECRLLSVAFKKQKDGRTSCCYQITLSNKLPPHAKIFPSAFQVSINNGNITDVYATSNTWAQKPQTVPPKTKTIVWNHISSKIPRGKTNMATICVEGLSPVWLQYAWLDRMGKVLCRDSVQINDCVIEPTDFCENPLIQNDGFAPSPAAAPPANWSVGYGSPVFVNTPSSGFLDIGHVEASGNQTRGDAITQILAPANKIYRGKKYLLTVGARFLSSQNTLDYARIRAVAYNGPLPGLGGTHPGPGPNLAIVGRSGKIKDCGEWILVEFFVWTANKDFQNIALNVFTNDGTSAQLLIDNVSLCEVSNSDCEEIQLDAANKPIRPPGLPQPPTSFPCISEEEEDEYSNGSLLDLYGGSPYNYNGTTSWYANAGDKCFSIGGMIPTEVSNYNCDDSLKLVGLNITCDSLQKLLEDPDVDEFTIPKLVFLPPIGSISDSLCLYPPPPLDEGNWAFKGKDIIYIHGLELGHVLKRAVPTPKWPGALANWPNDPQEFYEPGFYKNAAKDTWKDHIDYFTKNPNIPANNYRNRYLIVSYNCSQRLDIAVHCVLTQIREAMETGKDVEPNGDPRGTNCFGREYVIISQSTGAMVADVMLTIANDTKTDPALAANYGNIGLIADRCKGHIARRGAFTGSDLATLLVALAKPVPGATAIATGLMLKDGDSFVDFANPNNLSIIRSSILVDLIPKIARNKWGPYIDRVPVKVLTVAGGHPSFLSQKELLQGGAVYGAAPAIGSILGLGGALPPIIAQILKVALTFKYVVHPGFDDGVITTDCANGRRSTFFSPSTFQASSPLKVFDMGIDKARAASYYIDQRKRGGSLSTFCSGATPYLSPTGMVQPVSSFSLNQPYHNHFTFVQAAGEHWIKTDVTSCDYRTTAIGGSRNYEEELVVNDASLYNPVTGIIDSGIIPQMGENIKGKTIPIFYIKIKRVKGFPVPVVCSRPYYIWKRTYHKFGADCLLDCDYVYRYLFRN